jgi:hypothetical protein
MESQRNVRDWQNSMTAGALTGALALGIKFRSPAAVLVGSLIFGAGAALPDLCVE